MLVRLQRPAFVLLRAQSNGEFRARLKTKRRIKNVETQNARIEIHRRDAVACNCSRAGSAQNGF